MSAMIQTDILDFDQVSCGAGLGVSLVFGSSEWVQTFLIFTLQLGVDRTPAVARRGRMAAYCVVYVCL